MKTGAIDPGVNGLGASAFDADALIDARYIRGAPDLRAWLAQHFSSTDRMVIEFPRIYRAAQQKGDQNDLLHVARAVGRVQEAAERIGMTIELIIPRDWKGTLDGDAMVKRIQGRVSGAELARIALPTVSLQHNVWDAVGIGLHATGRLAPKRVVPR